MLLQLVPLISIYNNHHNARMLLDADDDWTLNSNIAEEQHDTMHGPAPGHGGNGLVFPDLVRIQPGQLSRMVICFTSQLI